jgi:hypothetical protein
MEIELPPGRVMLMRVTVSVPGAKVAGLMRRGVVDVLGEPAVQNPA